MSEEMTVYTGKMLQMYLGITPKQFKTKSDKLKLLFKQIGKSLISLPILFFGGPVGMIIALGTSMSSVKSFLTLTVNGPLSKPIKKVVNDTLGDPVEQ